MSVIQTFLPSWLKPVSTINVSGDFGVTSAKYASGKEIFRTYYSHRLSIYSLKFYLDDSDDDFQRSMNFLRWACGGLNPFWFTDPHPQYDLRRLIGAGDGSKTTFVVPITTTDTITILVDGIPVTATIHTGGPNLLDNATSIATSGPYFSVVTKGGGSGSLASAPAVHSISQFDQHGSIKINCAAASYGVRNSSIVSASPGDKFTTLVSALSSASPLMTVTNTLNYYDAVHGTLLTKDASDDLDVTGKIFTLASTETAPASTVGVEVMCMVGDVGSVWFIGCAINRGDLSDWWRGDVSLPVAELASAPASGSIVEAHAASGIVSIRGKADSVSREVDAAGGKSYTLKMRELPNA